MSEIVENQEVEANQESKNSALLIWIGTIFFAFIPALIFYFIKKEDKFIMSHTKEALNWSITATIAYVIAFILTIVVIGALLIPVIAILNLVFCVMGAMAASKGQMFKVPLTIRLIK